MDVFRIRDFEIKNRLFVGTGKYATYELMQQAHDDVQGGLVDTSKAEATDATYARHLRPTPQDAGPGTPDSAPGGKAR